MPRAKKADAVVDDVVRCIVPDPRRCGSYARQEVGQYGVFPVPVAESGRSEAEWQQLLTDDPGVPLLLADLPIGAISDYAPHAAALHQSLAPLDDPADAPEEAVADGETSTAAAAADQTEA